MALYDSYLAKKISVLLVGPKGLIALKGKLLAIEGGVAEVELEKGMMGKAKKALFSLNSVAGLRLEE